MGGRALVSRHPQCADQSGCRALGQATPPLASQALAAWCPDTAPLKGVTEGAHVESTARIPGLVGQVLGTLSAATLEGALAAPTRSPGSGAWPLSRTHLRGPEPRPPSRRIFLALLTGQIPPGHPRDPTQEVPPPGAVQRLLSSRPRTSHAARSWKRDLPRGLVTRSEPHVHLSPLEGDPGLPWTLTADRGDCHRVCPQAPLGTTSRQALQEPGPRKQTDLVSVWRGPQAGSGKVSPDEKKLGVGVGGEEGVITSGRETRPRPGPEAGAWVVSHGEVQKRDGDTRVPLRKGNSLGAPLTHHLPSPGAQETAAASLRGATEGISACGTRRFTRSRTTSYRTSRAIREVSAPGTPSPPCLHPGPRQGHGVAASPRPARN
ncbi:uncharacterized protein LOC119866818 isoform X3 [Canis lupus familiaris]|uniref:uncharacterized protein LOC119866818 isoform X3 n=1 Tax=Canis lupus familiaris TaxID=9615 RepID=UPI0018F2A270|nr:uncharacterized protein LOC119866818 isoform X3 [Canis lupus familiaris]